MVLMDGYDVANKAFLCDPSFDTTQFGWFSNDFSRLKIVKDDLYYRCFPEHVRQSMMQSDKSNDNMNNAMFHEDLSCNQMVPIIKPAVPPRLKAHPYSRTHSKASMHALTPMSTVTQSASSSSSSSSSSTTPSGSPKFQFAPNAQIQPPHYQNLQTVQSPKFNTIQHQQQLAQIQLLTQKQQHMFMEQRQWMMRQQMILQHQRQQLRQQQFNYENTMQMMLTANGINGLGVKTAAAGMEVNGMGVSCPGFYVRTPVMVTAEKPFGTPSLPTEISPPPRGDASKEMDYWLGGL